MSCTEYDVCKECITGYKWDESTKECSSTCPEGKYFDSKALSCDACKVEKCISCDSATDCFKCAEGYHLEVYTCLKKKFA